MVWWLFPHTLESTTMLWSASPSIISSHRWHGYYPGHTATIPGIHLIAPVFWMLPTAQLGHHSTSHRCLTRRSSAPVPVRSTGGDDGGGSTSKGLKRELPLQGEWRACLTQESWLPWRRLPYLEYDRKKNHDPSTAPSLQCQGYRPIPQFLDHQVLLIWMWFWGRFTIGKTNEDKRQLWM